MAIPLKQSTASQEVPLGYFLDSTDGNSEETGLTIANTDIKLWKNGATTLANKNSGGATHISNGIYYAVLDATDTNTLGSLVIFCHVSGALAVRVECVVYPAVIYDSVIAGTDYLQTDLTQIAGSAVNTAAAQLGVNVVDWKGSTAAAMTGDAFARLGAPAGASVSADVAAVKSDSAAILDDTGTNGVVVAAGSKTGYSLAADQSAVTIGTVTTLTGHTAQTGDSFAIVNGASGLVAIEGHLTGIKGATFNGATDSLEAIRDRGDAEWITATGFSTHSAADVWTATNATLSLAYGVIAERLYRFLMNKMNITDATGAVALRNEADDGDVATQSISDNDTTTTRTALSWS